MARLQGASDFDKLKDLTTKPYKDQAIWYLNAFWEESGKNEAENLWKYVQKLHELDPKKEKGNELEDWNQHRFLEFFQNTMTVQQMRDSLRSTGAITDSKLKMVPFIHWLIFHYKSDWHKLVNASQGDNKAEIEEAQKKLDQVQAAFRESEAKANEAKEREAAATKSETEAKAKAADSKKKEDELRAAKEELEAALRELKAQEDARDQKTQELKKKSEDESIGLVTRNKAKNELAQHLNEDPLPLRKAKITQEAAVKKADRAAQAAAEAREAADKSAHEASEARAAAAKAKEAAEAAVEEMAQKLAEAEAFFEEVKSKPGNAAGAMWWIDRELHEAKAYLPEKRGGYRKNK